MFEKHCLNLSLVYAVIKQMGTYLYFWTYSSWFAGKVFEKPSLARPVGQTMMFWVVTGAMWILFPCLLECLGTGVWPVSWSCRPEGERSNASPSTWMKGRLNGFEVIGRSIWFLNKVIFSFLFNSPSTIVRFHTNMANGSEVLLGSRKRQRKCI